MPTSHHPSRSLLLPTLLCAAIIAGASLPAAAEVPAAGENPTNVLFRGGSPSTFVSRRGQGIKAGTFASRPATQIGWNAGANTLIEAVFRDQKNLAAFKSGVQLEVDVNTDGFAGLDTVGLRVIDAQGEIHQYGRLHLPQGTGWKIWRVDLTPKRVTDRWGGNGDGKGRIDPPVKLLSLLFNAPEKPTEPRSILVGEIRRSAFRPDDVEPEIMLQQLEARIALPDHPIAMVTPATADGLQVSVRNTSAVPISFALTVQMTGPGPTTNSWQAPQEMTLPAGEHYTHPLGSMLKAFGPWVANLTVTGAGGQASLGRGRTRFVYIDPAGPRPHPPTDGFWFGIDARLRDAEQDAWQAEACSLIGADYLRAGLTWPHLQPQGPQGGAWNRHIEILDMLGKHGLKASYGLSFTPDWAVRDVYKGKPKPSSAPAKPEAWRTFVEAVAKVNREHGVVSYEIWNEPDLEGFWHGTTDEYLETLVIANEAIKAHHPEATVICGGMATLLGHGGQNRNPDLIRRTYVEKQAHYDAIGLHEHGSFLRFRQSLTGPVTGYREQMTAPKPLWFTETGIPASEVGEQRQAEILVKKHAFARAMNTQGFTWFVFTLGHEGGFSLVNNKREPTAACAAYNAMTRLMRGKRFAALHDVGPGNYLIEFGGAGGHLFVAWDEDPSTSGDVVPLRLATQATAEWVDLYGNAAPAVIADQAVALALAPRVCYLRVQSADRPGVLPPVARFTSEVLAESGKPVAVAVQLRNPLPRAVNAHLLWQATGNSNRSETVRLDADAAADIVCTFTAPPGAAAGEVRPTMTLQYRLDDTAWQGRITTEVQQAQVIPADAPQERQPDFDLGRREQVFNPNENDPNRKAFAWAGPDDLSAKVWLQLDGDALVLTAAVQDDRHQPAATAADMWQKDSVQFALVVPGQTGFWEIGLGKGAEGPMAHVWNAPSGLEARPEQVALSVESVEGGLRYQAQLPLKVLGLTADALRQQGIRFNLLINDDDLGKREGWIEVAPNLGKDKNPATFPTVRFD